MARNSDDSRLVRVRLRPVRPVYCKPLILFASAGRASGCVWFSQAIDFIVRPVRLVCSPIPPTLRARFKAGRER